MSLNFSAALSELRRQRNLSQRQVAADLGVSQALLSHYENGLREPRLDFVVKVCDYYDVSADFILGREDRSAHARRAEELFHRMRELCDEADAIFTDSSKRDDV